MGNYIKIFNINDYEENSNIRFLAYTCFAASGL